MPPKQAAVPAEFDFDALLAEHRLDPVPVKLGGHVYQVRRDFRSQELRDFEAAVARGDDGELDAMAIVLGADDATRYVDHTNSLPHEHGVLVTQKILVAAKLRQASQYDWGKADDQAAAGSAGESTAS